MESPKLLGAALDCECGKRHEIAPAELLYAPDAAERMPELCALHAAGRRVAVLFDARTRLAAGEEVVRALAADGWQVCEVLVEDRPDGASPVCDEAASRSVQQRMGEVDLVVAVGSGVLSDLGKWSAYERDLPAVTFATAASMNGYAAANVASAVEGVKVVVRARPPAAVATSPRVLADAPAVLAGSGLSDVLAKSVSSADWRMNHLLFGDYYCPRSVGLIERIEPLYLENPEGVRTGEAAATAALFDALILTGVAMTMAETSDPASGGEHLISHTLDMTAMAAGREHDMHGRQVGVGTVLASELYRRVLSMDSPDFDRGPAGTIDAEFWGPLAGVVSEHYRTKAPRLQAAREKLRGGSTWDDLRGVLAPMTRSPGALADCIARAGSARTAADLGVSGEWLIACLLHAHQMRGRFTILDLAWMTGVLPAAAGEIVEQWAM
jgi:glycerol-1-phosphate dehydrogenase [NAD(P)+]